MSNTLLFLSTHHFFGISCISRETKVYAILSRNPIFLKIRAFGCKILGHKILPVYKKWQISGMDRRCGRERSWDAEAALALSTAAKCGNKLDPSWFWFATIVSLSLCNHCFYYIVGFKWECVSLHSIFSKLIFESPPLLRHARGVAIRRDRSWLWFLFATIVPFPFAFPHKY